MNLALERLVYRVYESRRKLATAGIVTLVCVLAYHAIFGPNGFLMYQQKRSELQKVDHEIQKLQEENARSEQDIKALKSDPQAIEKEAREHLHYARGGEIIYKLPEATPNPSSKK